MTGIPRFKSYEQELREEHGSPNNQIVTVSGLAGTGTTTVARALAESFEFDQVNAGEFFRGKAREHGMSLQEFDEKTAELEAKEGTDFDLEWDRTALKYAFTRDQFLLEGRLAGPLLLGIAPVRIYVSCDLDVVADRICRRENLTEEKAREYVTVRNREVLHRYEKKYGIDPTDERYYNVFIENTGSFGRVRDELIQKVEEQLV